LETSPKSLLDSLRFDIFERVHLADKDKPIEIIEETELTPQIKMLMSEDQIKLVGNLLLKIKYVGGDIPWISNEFQHSIPVEITIPANRVSDAWMLDADIENFNIEQVGSRSLNVTGVLKVYEKERIRMDKVKLTQLQADVLETELKSSQINGDKSKFVKMYVNLGDDDWQDGYPLTCLKNDDLIRALYIGYAVEQTPEEQIRAHFLKHWENQKTFSVDRDTSKVICVTITNVLNTLNIKIEGVND
jgi:hypothetical protein